MLETVYNIKNNRDNAELKQEKEKELYDEKIAEYTRQGYSDTEAVEQAEQWVAVPGCSEQETVTFIIRLPISES